MTKGHTKIVPTFGQKYEIASKLQILVDTGKFVEVEKGYWQYKEDYSDQTIVDACDFPATLVNVANIRKELFGSIKVPAKEKPITIREEIEKLVKRVEFVEDQLVFHKKLIQGLMNNQKKIEAVKHD